MLRIVIDTDVMVAAFDSDTGASRRLLLSALDGHFGLLLSTSLMVEYEAVLTRPAMLARSGLGVGDVLSILDDLAGLCIPVGFDFRWRPMAGDADDDHVLETAVNGVADAIASFNLKHLAEAGRRFGIPVLRPGDLLKRM